MRINARANPPYSGLRLITIGINVVSELMRPEHTPLITAWAGKQPTRSLFLTAIIEAELRF